MSHMCPEASPPYRSSEAQRPRKKSSRSPHPGPRPRPSWGPRGGRCWLRSSRFRGDLGEEAWASPILPTSHTAAKPHVTWSLCQPSCCPAPIPHSGHTELTHHPRAEATLCLFLQPGSACSPHTRGCGTWSQLARSHSCSPHSIACQE